MSLACTILDVAKVFFSGVFAGIFVSVLLIVFLYLPGKDEKK